MSTLLRMPSGWLGSSSLSLLVCVFFAAFAESDSFGEMPNEPTLSLLVSSCESKSWDVALQNVGRRQARYAQPDGMTALHWAAFHGHVDLAARIIEASSDPDPVTIYQITPLSLACQNGDTEMAKHLLAAGANAKHQTLGDVSCVMLAARAGQPEIIRQLADHGADVNANNRDGQTALMWAAAAGHAGAIDALVRAGADLDAKRSSEFTALMFAARQGRREAAFRLIEHGCDVNEVIKPQKTGGRRPRARMSPLMFATESAHYELAIELVKAGADPNDQRSGFAPLHALSWVRRPQRGDDPNGDPPPRGSGTVTSLEFVRRMVALGADVNLQLRRGKPFGNGQIHTRDATAFLLASQKLDLPLMKTLVELGADPMLNNFDDCSPLLAAAGVGAHAVDEHPGTPQEVEAVVRYLLQLGLDLNHVDKNGETVMHGAAYRSYPESVVLFDRLGAKVDVWDHRNQSGWTPLIIAKGYRQGAFKPSADVMTAIRALRGDRQEAKHRPKHKSYPDKKPATKKSKEPKNSLPPAGR